MKIMQIANQHEGRIMLFRFGFTAEDISALKFEKALDEMKYPISVLEFEDFLKKWRKKIDPCYGCSKEWCRSCVYTISRTPDPSTPIPYGFSDNSEYLI